MRLLSFLLIVALGLTERSSVFTWRATLGGSESLSPTPPSDSALVGTWEATPRRSEMGDRLAHAFTSLRKRSSLRHVTYVVTRVAARS